MNDSLSPVKDLVIEITPRGGKANRHNVKLNSIDHSSSKSRKQVMAGDAEIDLDLQLYSRIIRGKKPYDNPWSIMGRVYLRDARLVGENLLAFFPPEIYAEVMHQYNLAKEGSQSLRILIGTVSNDVGDLPWELLCTRDGEFFCLDPRIAILRHIPVQVSSPPPVIDRPLKVLFVLTNPKDESVMNSQQELDAIAKAVDTKLFRTSLLMEANINSLERELKISQPNIVHYIGHGGLAEGQGNLILHNSWSSTYWLSPEQLARVLPPSTRLLCLSTCFTVKNYQIQAFNRFSQKRGLFDLPNVVVNQFQIPEMSITSFWRGFYAALAETGSVERAMIEGRSRIAHPSQVDWASFVLHLRTGTDQIFSLEQPISTEGVTTNGGVWEETKKMIKALEIQADFLGGTLNDLRNESSRFSKVPVRLEYSITGTEKRYYDIIGQLDRLKRNAGYVGARK